LLYICSEKPHRRLHINSSIKTGLLLVSFLASTLLTPAVCHAQRASNPDFPHQESSGYSDYPEYGGDESTNVYDYLDQEGESGYEDSENYYGEPNYESADTGGYDDEYDEAADVSEAVEPAPPPARQMLKPGDPINIAEKTIRVGRIPYLSVKQLMAQAVPLLRSLQKRTGAKEVRLVSSGSYSDIISALARGKIDFAWVGPTAYLKHRDKENLMAVAKAKFGDETAYRGVFIAPAKGKVQGLEDLSGNIIGFVDPESASGYIYPNYLLKTLKIRLSKKTRVAFLKNHDNVLLAVLKGRIDAGACLEKTVSASKIKDLDKRIIVLAKTEEIPSDVIVCRQDCALNLREKFQEALTGIKPGELPGSPLTFLAATDDEFAPVEAVMRYLKLLP